ncbi:WGxxGxxG family protein [Paenibacillus sp.]|uniref:WGxxGxxG family protein n=1 Tax=Paenibacillus sp. TaxID=58172 RepID=UPI0028114FFF|nr:WGxxGxxG family protein [Paenibacillus sp.]
MKKISTLALTAVLACSMAVPAFAEGGNSAASSIGHGTQNGVNATGANGGGMTTNRATTTDTNGVNGANRYGYGTNARGANTGYGMNGVRMNNQTRANAAANDDGVDWGWIGLAGLLGLAGLRGREKAK